MALGVVGALAGMLVLALADAGWAARAREGASLIDLALAAVGLLAPMTILMGVTIGAMSWLIHPRAEPSISGLIRRLRAAAVGRPADIAAFVPLATLGLFFWATLAAQSARVLLSLEASPALRGATLAVASLVLALVLALVVLALTPPLRRALANLHASWRGWVDPAITLGLALALCLALFGYGVASGTVSGDGGFFGIYGIFKRGELDLRAPGSLALLCVAIYLAPSLLGGMRSRWALLLAPVALVATVHAARSLNDDPDSARLIERSAPIGARPLAVLRKLTDRDGDGASPWFGGGDCDDRNPAIGPGAEDIPDNGIDEDCSGSDLSLAGLADEEPAQAADTAPAAAAIPEDGNLILITVDTLRWDLGYMGYQRPVSPNLDALAKRSTVFERAYALASYTGKSIGPMLIGKYGSETNRNWGHFNKFGADDTFLAERLQRAGVHTIAVHGHRYFGPFGGLERGFDVLDLSAAPPEGTSWATDTTNTSKPLTDAAIARLQEAGDKRFFLWVHYLDPHADYLQHDEVPKFGNRARDLYDNEVAYTDLHIGRLLDYIAEQPWADKTSIVVTSDHGEAFGENGMWRHGFEVWETLVRVPLIVHVPGAEPSRIAARRSLIDILPTALELMGLPRPPPPTEAPADSHDFASGLSLVPDVFLPPGDEPAARDVIVDMPAGPYNDARRAFIHGDLKLIISRDQSKELFDLAADPTESKNIWSQRGDEIEALYARAKSRMRIIEVTGKRR